MCCPAASSDAIAADFAADVANDCSIAASDSRPALIIDCASEFAAADAAAELLDAFASFAEASEAVESALCCPAASSDAIAADFAADVAI